MYQHAQFGHADPVACANRLAILIALKRLAIVIAQPPGQAIVIAVSANSTAAWSFQFSTRAPVLLLELQFTP